MAVRSPRRSHSSRLNNLRSPVGECSSPNHLGGLQRTRSPWSVSFLRLGGPKLDAGYRWSPNERCIEGDNRFPRSPGFAPVHTAQEPLAASAARAGGWPVFSLPSAKVLGPHPQSCSPGGQSPACVATRGSSFPGVGLGVSPGLFSSGSRQPVPPACQDPADGGPALRSVDFSPQFGVICKACECIRLPPPGHGRRC